ncbi:MAG: hypothetical protein AAF798_02830 [Bacteroidota bacterium]
MSQAGVLQHEKYLLREVIPFPRADEFFNLLQDRVHMAVRGYTLPNNFTMFINALPREELSYINRYENVPLVYAGIPRQRELLESDNDKKAPGLEEYWNFLDVTDLLSDTAVVSSKLYREFGLGEYRLDDIPRVGMGSLEDYFESILYPERTTKEPTPRQVAEYNILKEFFDVHEDEYLSVPLIQFGEFDGIVHIVYSGKDAQLINRETIKRLIRSICEVYQNLILDWDLVGRNPEKSDAIQLPISEVFYQQINRNPILKELEFDKYYKRYLPYFKARIRLNDKVIHSKVYAPYLKTAIISIMIDSYAHNISAHSLVALNWWFKRRAESLRSTSEEHYMEVEEVQEIIGDYVPKGFELDRLVKLLQPWMEGQFVKEESADNDVIRYPGSLAREIQPLLGFLMQKGAFWSGIARDNHFGGEAKNLFNVLWEDFINNPLYLGTIAKSEDIHKISLQIVLYAPEGDSRVSNLPFRKAKEVLAEGTFVEIDIKKKRERSEKDEIRGYFLSLPDGSRLYYDEYSELVTMSSFVRPGQDYAMIKQVLQDAQLFFPGEVVGRHAFFTMLENEIRNVKHYKGKSLQHIQKHGLQLTIALQEASVQPHQKQEKEKELYKVGVWINTPTDLRLRNSELLIRRKFDALVADIMDEDTFAPKLGGSYQDKICAGMLFNNKFGLVQRGDNNPARDRSFDTPRDAAFYPWISPATSSEMHPHDDMELNKKVMSQKAAFTQVYKHQSGYLKKYFYIWKASNIKEVAGFSDTDFVWENLARFKFVNIQGNAQENAVLWQEVRSNGVIRIIDQKIDTTVQESGADILAAYEHWLKKWVAAPTHAIKILVDGAVTGYLLFDVHAKQAFRYLNTNEVEQLDGDPGAAMSIQQELHLAHGGPTNDPKLLRYRNHGIYKTYFLKDVRDVGQVTTANKARFIELFEVLCTRICIFDNRIKHRIRGNEREDLFKNTLNMAVHEEQAPYLDEKNNWQGLWERESEVILKNCHFLIIHLSYIEKILMTKYSEHVDFEDENIGLFIEKEILPWVTINGKVRENFILVITSGRGRTKWWIKLTENPKYQQYTTFTMFRPVESLISGMEDALGRKDDIELKYNLVKVLFGT